MPKRIDLTGKKFGKLTVEYYVGKSKWHCKCDCGNEVDVKSQSLREGVSKSCGCLQRKDLTGKRFGKLTVIKYSYTKNCNRVWLCKCDCGNYTYVTTSLLSRGVTKSCGCNVHRHRDYSYLVGKKFNLLTVTEYLGYKDGKHLVKCKCDCGNYTIKSVRDLRLGRVKSCGCLTHEHRLKEDLVGKKFSYLTVLSLYGTKSGHVYWKCKCDCGKTTVVESYKLKFGLIKSCGCLDIAHRGSQQENEIKDYVQSLLPNEKIEKSKVLYGKEIDIYIPRLKFGIEYNGSAYHASKNGVYSNKNKYYHRDKFLQAKSKGIYLMTIFDKYYFENKYKIFDIIKNAITNNGKFFIPMNEIEYTNNNYTDGKFMLTYGYEEVGQEEPNMFEYEGFEVYECGTTKWHKI